MPEIFVSSYDLWIIYVGNIRLQFTRLEIEQFAKKLNHVRKIHRLAPSDKGEEAGDSRE